MNTDLTVPGSQTLTVVADTVEDLQLVARNADEMRVAQSQMAEWFKQKAAMVRKDAAELEENFEIALKNGWKTDALKRQAKIAHKRAAFYEKCHAASVAGYCIIPNLPGDVFAVRTKKSRPPGEYGSNRDRHLKSEGPDLGEGKFVDHRPITDEITRKVKNEAGHEYTRTDYWNVGFDDEIEFPISVSKPAIMSAAAQAMALKCFDEMAVIENKRTRKGDPLVVGIIRDPRRQGPWDNKRVTFLIGWYVDTSTL